MFTKQGYFLMQTCKRSNPFHNHSLIFNNSVSSKSPSYPPPTNSSPVMDSPITTPRSDTKPEVAPIQTLPSNLPPMMDSPIGTSRSSTEKEDAPSPLTIASPTDTSGTGANKEDATKYEHNHEDLWKNVVVLNCESSSESGSCDVYLVGTAHVSMDSCKEVQAVIRHIKPQAVFLELCPGRVSILTAQAQEVPTMQQMIDMWKKKKMNAFGIVYSYFLAKVAEKLEVLPGAEFRVAYEEASRYGATIILGDRAVQITLRRTWGNMSLWHRTKFLYYIFFQSFFLPSPEDMNKMLKEMNNADMVTVMIQELSKVFPTLIETLINERDMYMSASLLKASKVHSSVVAVVGRGHVQGIVKYWKQHIDTKRLTEIPTKSVGIISVRALASVGVATGLALATGLYFFRKR